jgi:hypothetical protein
MKAEAILFELAGAAAAAADSRALAWHWWHETSPAAARMHRW